jgi:hypothetical protein
MPSKEFNVSINELKKQALNSRKRQRDTIAISKTEIPFSEIFTSENGDFSIDDSNLMFNHNLDATKKELEDSMIVISDSEKYNASDLMMPELLKGGSYAIQKVPKHVSDKIDSLFEISRYQKQYMMLKLYLNGFTIGEIAEFYGMPKEQKTTVSKFIRIAKQRILDNLTLEELATCYWWIRVPKPILPIKEIERPVQAKKEVKAVNPWKELNDLYNNFRG